MIAVFPTHRATGCTAGQHASHQIQKAWESTPLLGPSLECHWGVTATVAWAQPPTVATRATSTSLPMPHTTIWPCWCVPHDGPALTQSRWQVLPARLALESCMADSFLITLKIQNTSMCKGGAGRATDGVLPTLGLWWEGQ